MIRTAAVSVRSTILLGGLLIGCVLAACSLVIAKDKKPPEPDRWLTVVHQSITENGFDEEMAEKIGKTMGPRYQERYAANAAYTQRMEGKYLNLITAEIDGVHYVLKETSDHPIILPGAVKFKSVPLNLKVGVVCRKHRITMPTVDEANNVFYHTFYIAGPVTGEKPAAEVWCYGKVNW